MLAQTYIFCIPLFGDQFDMANNLADYKLGVYVRKEHVNVNTCIFIYI